MPLQTPTGSFSDMFLLVPGTPKYQNSGPYSKLKGSTGTLEVQVRLISVFSRHCQLPILLGFNKGSLFVGAFPAIRFRRPCGCCCSWELTLQGVPAANHHCGPSFRRQLPPNHMRGCHKWGSPKWTPKYYDPWYRGSQKGSPNFWKPPYPSV